MKLRHAVLALFLCAGSAHADIHVPSQTNILWVDLRSLVTYRPDTVPQADMLMTSLNQYPTTYFAEDFERLYGVELNAAPERTLSGHVFHITATVKTSTSGLVFYKLALTTAGNPEEVKSFKLEDLIAANETHFTYSVGLIQRKAVLEDTAHGIKKIYALAVGGFDEGLVTPGETRLLTPRFNYGHIDKVNAIASRTVPAYYKGMPFMPITDGGEVTDIAFHIYITDTFSREFSSHGCMRMDEDPVKELYQILMAQPDSGIPVTTQYLISDGEEHPMPWNNSEYERYKNFGTPENPVIERDPVEHLVVMEGVEGMPPYANIYDLNHQVHAEGAGNEFELFSSFPTP